MPGRRNYIIDLIIRSNAQSQFREIRGQIQEQFVGSDGKGGLFGRMAVAAAFVGAELARGFIEADDRIQEILQRLRIETGQAELSQDERDLLGNVLSIGVSEGAGIEGVSSLRRFREVEDPTERFQLAGAAARLSEAGVNLDSFNRIVRREFPEGITGQEYQALAELAFTIPTAQGTEPGQIVSQVAPLSPLLSEVGYDLPSQLSLAASLDYAGFSISDVGAQIGRGSAIAAENDQDPAAFVQNAIELIRQAESPTAATQLGTAAFGRGINPAADQRFITAIRSGAFGPTISPGILDESGLTSVYGTEADRIQAAITRQQLGGGAFGVAATGSSIIRDVPIAGDLFEIGLRDGFPDRPGGLDRTVGDNPLASSIVRSGGLTVNVTIGGQQIRDVILSLANEGVSDGSYRYGRTP